MSDYWLESDGGAQCRAACDLGWRGEWRSGSQHAYADLDSHIAQCQDPDEDYCGCCGNGLRHDEYEWCDGCDEHVGRFSGYAWDRTYFAIHGEDCPYQVGREATP